MRTITIYFSTGEVLKHLTPGTNPQLQRVFFIGRVVGNKTIEALTIEQ